MKTRWFSQNALVPLLLRTKEARLLAPSPFGRGGKKARFKSRNKTWTNAIVEKGRDFIRPVRGSRRAFFF